MDLSLIHISEPRILIRVVEWTESGIKYEADQRHADIIVHKLGYEENSNGVVTPGERREAREYNEEEEMPRAEATMYRALVARANYLAQDRSDIAFAVKELCAECRPLKWATGRPSRGLEDT